MARSGRVKISREELRSTGRVLAHRGPFEIIQLTDPAPGVPWANVIVLGPSARRTRWRLGWNGSRMAGSPNWSALVRDHRAVADWVEATLRETLPEFLFDQPAAAAVETGEAA